MTILTITHKFTAIIHKSGASHLELDQNTGSALPANSRAVPMACLCVPWWSLPNQTDANLPYNDITTTGEAFACVRR